MKRIFDIFTKNKTQPVIVVSGLPRSGTSMMMAMLEAGGIPSLTDEIREADEDNPKGYYEFEPVKQLKDGNFSWVPRAQGKVVKIISALLSHLPDDHMYLVVFMRRAMPEILASQKKMLVNRGEDPDEISDEDMRFYFENHLSKVMKWLDQQKNIGVLYIDYNQLLEDPAPSAAQVNAFLGDKLDEERMVAVVDPKLYRQRKNSG